MYLKKIPNLLVIPLIFLGQYKSLVIDQTDQNNNGQNVPQNRAARESAEKIIDLKFTNHRKLNDKNNENSSNDDHPSKLITDLETEEINVIDQGTKHIASQILNSELSKTKSKSDNNNNELDHLMDQLITSEVVDKLYDDIMKRLENSQDTRNIFCENNGNFLKKSGVHDSNNENSNSFANDMNDASNNFDEVDGVYMSSASQSDLRDTTKPEIKNDIRSVFKDAIMENPGLFNFNRGSVGQSSNFQQSKQSLNPTSVIQDILLKSAGVFVVVGLMGMALINIKANKRQKGIPRNENTSENSHQTELNRGDSHENSHLQSTLFLNHQDRDSRNLQSVSTVSNSC